MRRVAIVDDHRVVADLFDLVVSRAPDLELAGRAGSAHECLAHVGEWDADVVVMDVHLGDGDGLALTATLTARHPELCVVVLTAQVDGALLRRAAAAGACALLPKDGDLEAVLAAIRTVEPSGRGEVQVHPALGRRIAAAQRSGQGLGRLTAREQQVLRLLATGMDVRQVSRETGTTVHTTRGHVKNVLAKLDAHSQLEAVAVAMRHGLLAPALD